MKAIFTLLFPRSHKKKGKKKKKTLFLFLTLSIHLTPLWDLSQGYPLSAGVCLCVWSSKNLVYWLRPRGEPVSGLESWWTAQGRAGKRWWISELQLTLYLSRFLLWAHSVQPHEYNLLMLPLSFRFLKGTVHLKQWPKWAVDLFLLCDVMGQKFLMDESPENQANQRVMQFLFCTFWVECTWLQ